MSKFKILIIDDIETNLDINERRLTKNGYQVEIAESGQKAIEILQSFTPDLIILDVLMPGMSGADFCRIIRNSPKYKDTLILAWSVDKSSENQSQMLDIGADAFIAKESSINVFLSTVTRMLQRSGRHPEKRAELCIYIEDKLIYEFKGLYVKKSDPLHIELKFEQYNEDISFIGDFIAEHYDNWLMAKHIGDNFKEAEFEKRKRDWLLQIQKKGLELYDLVFDISDLMKSFGYMLGLLNQDTQHLTLRFEGANRNLALPFELMHNKSELPICLQHPISRKITNVSNTSHKAWQTFLTENYGKGIHILLIATEETMCKEIQEIAPKIKEAMEKIHISVDIYPSNLDRPVTYEEFLELFNKGKFQMIHHAGHSVCDRENPDQSYLKLYDENGDEKRITAIHFAELLKQTTPMFLYLSCCSGAEIGSLNKTDNYYLGLLDAAIRTGVPNAIAYRWTVAGYSARIFANQFYEGLLFNPYSLEVATLYARKNVFTKLLNKWDETWFSPILVIQNSNLSGGSL
jgi:CheY-like chemotaxis protein